jgi:MarR family transcriptional regulator, lower aerobic nicotinate degradation pathway regulator
MKASKTRTNPLRGLEDRPGFLIRRAHQISQALFVEECAGLNITATQFGVLWVLGHSVQLDQISIARLLGFDRSTTAMVVKLLEDRKLVLRSPDPNDRRRYVLRLTKAGVDLRLRALPPVDRVRTRLESVFTSAEAKTFSRLLDKFTRAHNDLRER